jgi:hypothetical protein
MAGQREGAADYPSGPAMVAIAATRCVSLGQVSMEATNQYVLHRDDLLHQGARAARVEGT